MDDQLREHHPQPGDDVTGDRPSTAAPDGETILEGVTVETRSQRRNRQRRDARQAAKTPKG